MQECAARVLEFRRANEGGPGNPAGMLYGLSEERVHKSSERKKRREKKTKQARLKTFK